MANTFEHSQTPLVSILMPTRNRVHFLTRAVESVKLQTHTNWELIIINDASDDETNTALSALATADSRIRFLTLATNSGGGIARNVGLKQVQGDYIAFLDDDDSWNPTKLERQVSVLQENPDISIVSCSFIRVRERSKKVICNPGVYSLEDLKLGNIFGSFSFCMVRQSDITGLEISPELRSCQDWDLWYKIIQRTGKLGVVTEDILASYDRVIKASISFSRRPALSSRVAFLRGHWQELSRGQKLYHLLDLRYRRTFISKRNPSFLSILRELTSFKNIRNTLSAAGFKRTFSLYAHFLRRSLLP